MMGSVQFSCYVTADLFDATIPTKFHPIGHTLQQKFKNFLNLKLDLQTYSCCYNCSHS